MGPKRGDSGPQSIYFSAPEQVIVLRSVQHMLRLVAYATAEHRRGECSSILPFFFLFWAACFVATDALAFHFQDEGQFPLSV